MGNDDNFWDFVFWAVVIAVLLSVIAILYVYTLGKPIKFPDVIYDSFVIVWG